MKYWRGYLVAGVLGAMSWALTAFAQTHTELVDMVYPYITRLIQTFLTQWSSAVPFCVWQVLLLAVGMAVLASIVLMVVLRWNPFQWFGWVLAAASLALLLHTGLYGLNFHAGPLADDIRLEMADVTVSQRVAAATYYRDKANDLAEQVQRNADGTVAFDDFETLATQAADGFHTMTYDKAISIFAGSTVPVKELGWADSFTKRGVTGVTVSITGESAVNPQIPAISMPFAICHEMAHRMIIVNDRDANFAAFLACDANSSVQFRYSAYFMAYLYCYRDLEADSGSAAKTALSELRAGMSDKLSQDIIDYESFWMLYKDPMEVQAEGGFNNIYLLAAKDEENAAPEPTITDLLTSWHYQEVILPTIVEEEKAFDPYDESQVDLITLGTEPTDPADATVPAGE